MTKEYRTLAFVDSPSGRRKMDEVINQFSNEEWTIKSKETASQDRSHGSTCCLGCILLPIRSKKKSLITVIMEREVDPNRKEVVLADNKDRTVTDFCRKPWYKTWWGILIITFFGMCFLAAMVGRISNLNSPTTTQTNQIQDTPKKAEFEIKIAGNSYADYNNRQLTFTVKNIGQAEAWPACWIEVSSPDKKYSSQDYITWNTPLASGDTKYFDGLMPVSGGGAYATQSEVNCSTDSLH